MMVLRREQNWFYWRDSTNNMWVWVLSWEDGRLPFLLYCLLFFVSEFTSLYLSMDCKVRPRGVFVRSCKLSFFWVKSIWSRVMSCLLTTMGSLDTTTGWTTDFTILVYDSSCQYNINVTICHKYYIAISEHYELWYWKTKAHWEKKGKKKKGKNVVFVQQHTKNL
jgi:hypothetical protein